MGNSLSVVLKIQIMVLKLKSNGVNNSLQIIPACFSIIAVKDDMKDLFL